MGQCLFPHRVRRREPQVSTGERGEWIQANICGKHSVEGEERRVIPPLPSGDVCGVIYNVNAFLGAGRSLL